MKKTLLLLLTFSSLLFSKECFEIYNEVIEYKDKSIELLKTKYLGTREISKSISYSNISLILLKEYEFCRENEIIENSWDKEEKPGNY